MGPFVPELITDQLNLLFAFFIGIAFGFVLEQAGFSSSRRLAGVFYGYDFTVLRVFFTAGITAMLGVLLLGFFGLLDLNAIYVNPTWLYPAIVGGVIMGVGFILGGYCPGTSVCAVAIGKVDAMFFVGGGILGALLFGELFPLYDAFYVSTALGPIKVYDSLGLPQGVFVLALVLIAVGAFYATTKLEQKVNPQSAPSLSFPGRKHVVAGAILVLLAFTALVLPDRQTYLLQKVASEQYLQEHPVQTMTPDELAFRILDGDRHIRIIDVRSQQQYADLALPGSVNFALTDLVGKEPRVLFAKRSVKKVVLGTDDRESRIGALLLMENGIENVVAVQGGMENFKNTILKPDLAVNTGTRWDADVIRFRTTASQEINRMIKESKNKVQIVRVVKKVKGGC